MPDYITTRCTDVKTCLFKSRH